MTRTIAVVAFLAGLLLAVRVMFFGVRKHLAEDQLLHRRWPLALAALLMVGGAALYLTVPPAGTVTGSDLTLVVISGVVAATIAWWIVHRSASLPSADPEDDPRFRFQGHIARVVEPIGNPGGPDGRIAFEFDGKRVEFRARWSTSDEWKPGPNEGATSGTAGSEVVIEIVEGDLAFVEPWAVVEQRL